MLEFKVALPGKSVKYVKSVADFANCSGGKILFGIEDNTRKAVDIDDENVFKTMEAAIEAVRSIGLCQIKEIDENIFEDEIEWKEMFFQRLRELKNAEKNLAAF